MSYMLLILEPTDQRATRTEAQGRAAYAQMKAFGEKLQAQGKVRAFESLASQRTAVRVRQAGAQMSVVDGPFAEVKEMIGGFFLLDVPTCEEAVAIARECPAAQWCTVEVRALAPCHDDSHA